MKINTFFYAIRQGIRNIGRNKMFSLASMATMAACIFMFGILFIVVTNFGKLVKAAEESVAVAVYFEPDITDARIREIGTEISKRVEVSECKYVSAEDAWEYVKENYFEGREDLAAAFEGDNPVANSKHYEIYLSDVSMQDSLVKYIESLDDVREVKQSELVANTLSDFNRLIGYVSVGIIAILLCVAVFLINNTVTVGISVRKEEIAIMKLIGATDFLVRFPFIVEGILIGFIGASVPLALLYVLYEKVVEYISTKFQFIGSMMDFVPIENVFRILIPVALILGVGIGFAGSAWTSRKHLKV